MNLNEPPSRGTEIYIDIYYKLIKSTTILAVKLLKRNITFILKIP